MWRKLQFVVNHHIMTALFPIIQNFPNRELFIKLFTTNKLKKHNFKDGTDKFKLAFF